jgi:hypothetical protein
MVVVNNLRNVKAVRGLGRRGKVAYSALLNFIPFPRNISSLLQPHQTKILHSCPILVGLPNSSYQIVYLISGNAQP